MFDRSEAPYLTVTASCASCRKWLLMHSLPAGYFFKSWWPSVLSSSLAVWYVMGCGWLGVVFSIVSAVLTFLVSFETISTPATIAFAYLAITNTYFTNYIVKFTAVVRQHATSVWQQTQCCGMYVTILIAFVNVSQICDAVLRQKQV